MKYKVMIAIILLISSCYTKKKAIEKFCNTKQVDTVITIHDTTIVESLRVDSVFSVFNDTIVLTKDKLVVRYFRTTDSVYLSGEYLGDTIYKTIYQPISVPCDTAKLTTLDAVKELRWWLVLIFFLGMLLSLYLFNRYR